MAQKPQQMQQTQQKPETPPPSAPQNGQQSAALAIQEAHLAPVAPDVARALDAALADDKLFETTEPDFWKPEKEGDTLVGAYLGAEKVGRLLQHGFGVRNRDGKGVHAVRVNGTHIITRALSEVETGRIVKLVYLGSEKTGTDGRTIRKFNVFVARKA